MSRDIAANSTLANKNPGGALTPRGAAGTPGGPDMSTHSTMPGLREFIERLDRMPELPDVPSWGEISEYSGDPVAFCKREARAMAHPREKDAGRRYVYALFLRGVVRKLREMHGLRPQRAA
jgi:hypothetical protein